MSGPWTHETERYRYATREDLPAFAAMLVDGDSKLRAKYQPVLGNLEQLYSLYHDENRRLEDLLGRSLSIWSQDRIPGQVAAPRPRRETV